MAIMLYILKEWYGMPPSIPIVFTFFAFIALGVYAATAIKSKKTVGVLAAAAVILYLACSPVSFYDVFGVGVYSTFLGGVATLFVVGCLVSLAARAVKIGNKRK